MFNFYCACLILIIMAESENPTIRRVREELNCAVCHDLFDTPKTLPCLHTFCSKCLVNSEASRRRLRARDDHENRVECPVCGNISELRGGIEGITTNFVYVKLVEHLNVHEKLTSGNPLECGKCQKDDKPSLSVSFCYDCQAPLCEFCLRMHKQTVDLAQHHICSLDEIRQSDLLQPAVHCRRDDVLYVCNKHYEPYKLYCFTCQEVICRDCTVTKKDHRDHSFEFISEIIESERAGLFGCIDPLRATRENFMKYSNLIKACEEDLRLRHDKRKKKIDCVIDESIKLLETRRVELQEAAQRAHDIKKKNVDLQLEEMDMIKGAVDSAIDFTHTTLEKGSDVEVMMYKKEILARSATLKEKYDSYAAFEVTESDSAHFFHDFNVIKNFGALCEAPCIETSEASGEGLKCPMQDEETTFIVQAKNDKKQPLFHGGGLCSTHISIIPAPSGQPEIIPNTVTDNQDGTYTVAYRPLFPGVNKVSVKFDGQDIKGSPFDVNVVRNYIRPIGEPYTFSLPHASPWGLAMITDTEMAVTASDCIVHVYNINGKEMDQVRSNFTRPYGISTDYAGYLWITDREAHTVQKFRRDNQGNFVKLFQFGSRGINAGQFSHPRGIAVNPINGYIYISDMKNNRIQIFKPDSPVPRYRHQFGRPGKMEGEFNLPAGICFNKDGNLVVCDDHNCRLQVFDPEGRFLKMIGSTSAEKGLLCSPIGIAIDFHGRYVITEFGSHCVTFLSPEGDILNCVRSIGKGYGQFIHPRGIAVDSSGYVYVADNENMRIARF